MGGSTRCERLGIGELNGQSAAAITHATDARHNRPRAAGRLGLLGCATGQSADLAYVDAARRLPWVSVDRSSRPDGRSHLLALGGESRC